MQSSSVKIGSASSEGSRKLNNGLCSDRGSSFEQRIAITIILTGMKGIGYTDEFSFVYLLRARRSEVFFFFYSWAVF